MVLAGCVGTSDPNESGSSQPAASSSVSPSPKIKSVWDGIQVDNTPLRYFGLPLEPGKPFTYPTQDLPQELREIFESAWQQTEAARVPGEAPAFSYVVEDGSPQWFVDYVLWQKDRMFERFGGLPGTVEEFEFIFAHNIEFVDAEIDRIALERNLSSAEVKAMKEKARGGDRWMSEDRETPGSQAQPNRLEFWSGDFEVQVYYAWPDYLGYAFDPHIATHELWHPLIEDDKNNAYGLLPCWFIEGQASVVGDVLGLENATFDEYMAVLMSHGWGTRRAENAWLGNLEEPLPNGWCPDNGKYQDGDTGTAMLIAWYGWDKALEYSLMPKGETAMSWFKKVYGFPIEDFYAEAEPYMKKFRAWSYQSRGIQINEGGYEIGVTYGDPTVLPNELSHYKELDSCDPTDNPIALGYSRENQLRYLSCGPDGQMHPDSFLPFVDQETLLPIRDDSEYWVWLEDQFVSGRGDNTGADLRND